MNNPYLDKDDIGFIIFYIAALFALLFYAIHIWFGSPGTTERLNIKMNTHTDAQVVEDRGDKTSVLATKKEENTLVEQGKDTENKSTSDNSGSTSFQGESIAKNNCFTCHQNGLLNAPRVGANEEWKKRLDQGFDVLYSHALNGFNNMPAKGGNTDLKDIEIEQAILFMLSQSNLKVPGKEIPEKKENTQKVTKQNAEQVNTTINKVNNTSRKKTFVILEEEPAPPVKHEELPGKKIYESHCASCHDSGSKNAPMTGEQKEWLNPFSKGIDNLSKKIIQDKSIHSDLNQTELDNQQITQAINYIMQQTFWPD